MKHDELLRAAHGKLEPVEIALILPSKIFFVTQFKVSMAIASFGPVCLRERGASVSFHRIQTAVIQSSPIVCL